MLVQVIPQLVRGIAIWSWSVLNWVWLWGIAIWSWSILNWVWNGIWNWIVIIVATTDAVSYTANDVANGTTSQGCASSKSITSEETATKGERSSEGSTCCEWSETQTEEWEKSVKNRWLT
jgi:hypothetical protein